MLAQDLHAGPCFRHACAYIGLAINAATALPTDTNRADDAFRASHLIETKATFTRCDQSRGNALAFASQDRPTFKIELECGHRPPFPVG
jgi:hypothetical protein